MALKRSNGEGSIHKRQNGTWEVQVTVEGYRLSHTFKTQQECQEWLKTTRRQVDDGMTFTSMKLTLKEFLSGWLISIKSSMKPRTWGHYEQLLRQYIMPSLGHIRIRDLRPDQIQDLYNLSQERKIGVFTIRKIHAVLHSALSQAVKLNMIGGNPASAAIMPQKPAREMAILDKNQIGLMLIAARDTRLEAMLYLAVMTGLREMEILGLRWSDLDWIKHTLKVERQLVRPEERNIQFASPKTKYGRRTISLGSNAIEVLRNHYERQHADRRTAGDEWKENDLRHTAASLMLNHDIPVLVVSRVLGHSRPSITLDVYGHLMPSMQAEAAEKMDALLAPIEFTGCSRLQQITHRSARSELIALISSFIERKTPTGGVS